MYCCVKKFRAPSGTGTGIAQTVSGIADGRTNTQFQPKILYFISSSCPANTLSFNPTALENTVVHEQGIWLDNGKSGVMAFGELPQFSTKITTNGGGPNRAIINYEADSFFGGTLYRLASVTATAVGSFDLSWDITNDFFTTDIICVALGGTDILYEILTDPYTTGNHVTTNALVAILRTAFPLIDNSSSPSGAAGFTNNRIGWAVNGGSYGAAGVYSIGTGGGGDNNRLQVTDTYAVQINSAGVKIGSPTVSAWNSNSVDVVNGSVSLDGKAIGIAGVQAANGSFRAPASDGNVTISTGINPVFLILASVGAAPSSVVRTDMMSYLLGVTDCVNEMSLWVGENSLDLPLNGARYLSDSRIGQLATPAAGSTTLHTLVSVTNVQSTGQITFSVTNTDGTEPEFIWLALGSAATPAAAGSGLYKMIPDKRFDELNEDVSAGTTIMVPIPDPFATTGLIGDE